MDNHSFLHTADNAYIEQLYQLYQTNPEQLEPGWRRFFEGFDFRQGNLGKSQINGTPSATVNALGRTRPLPNSQSGGAYAPPANASTFSGSESSDTIAEGLRQEGGVVMLVEEYRKRGHLFTLTNPIRQRRQYTPKITLDRFGLHEGLLDKTFQYGGADKPGPMTLRRIVERMEKTYCSNIGYEFKYVRNPHLIDWLEYKIESGESIKPFTSEEKKEIYEKLNETVLFETYLHQKFSGQKRFSIEGVETFIPALDTVIEYGAKLGAEECIIGMAHRGRLNVLANIMHKPYVEIFSEFEGKGYANEKFRGDVKYHMGYSSDRINLDGSKIHLSMPPNPSHLEAVDPVLEGVAHGKIQMRYKDDFDKLIPIIIHGDSSIAGQGIVYEVLQYSQLEGYKNGGTIHIVLNNQIGFTTGYLEARSSTYCTDIAKMTKSPVLHVNGDDVEAVTHAVKLALDFRKEFNIDVFIDILGYRRHGHNEGDDPRFTHPGFYRAISEHPNPKEIYKKKLLEEKVIDEAYIAKKDEEFINFLDNSLAEAKKKECVSLNSYGKSDWLGFDIAEESDIFHTRSTGVIKDKFMDLAGKATDLPDNIRFFSKVYKIYEERKKSVIEHGILDWAMAEQMALATLLEEGFAVRFSGQDSQRGTFSHRHCVLKSDDNEEIKYTPLQHVSKGQGDFTILNSPLSEYGILGFEYGYAMSRPNCLTLWEAQFGDFANGAQIIIDQFIVSGESKWQRMNGLVLLLPHGFEGQGPEHSSGRPERFLQLCGDNNIQVVNLTTPANFFHVLRRQMHRNFRKPLVVFTPKSLLRHPKCVSPLNDFLNETAFQEIIDTDNPTPDKVKKLLLCTGKIYYELREALNERHINDTAIVRVEQLYPLDETQLLGIYEKYSGAVKKIWVQEEPENQGAGQFFILKNLKLGVSLDMVSRKESPSISTGFLQIHLKEQRAIIDKALS